MPRLKQFNFGPHDRGFENFGGQFISEVLTTLGDFQSCCSSGSVDEVFVGSHWGGTFIRTSHCCGSKLHFVLDERIQQP